MRLYFILHYDFQLLVSNLLKQTVFLILRRERVPLENEKYSNVNVRLVIGTWTESYYQKYCSVLK